MIPDTTILLFKLSDISTLFNVTDLAHHPSLTQVPHGECYSTTTTATNNNNESPQDENESTTQDYLLSAQVLSRTAVALNRYRLAELCKLKPNDYGAGLADSILKNVATFERVKDEEFCLLDIPLSPVASPVPSPKQQRSFDPITIASTSAVTSTNNNTTKHNLQQGATISPHVNPVKSEPLSPPPLRLSQPKETRNDQRPSNSMALDKVLWSKSTDSSSPCTRANPE
ncbi:hypothetical protein BC941DRAFT_448266 [Chlamydoabsidia padenii]|nr:hypothetical protein BC941DRAFT_448266 [Chlamydoabsidia padenii]